VGYFQNLKKETVLFTYRSIGGSRKIFGEASLIRDAHRRSESVVK